MVTLYENGRFTIPRPIRERNGLKAGDLIELYERGDEIVIKAVKPNYTITEPQMYVIRKLYSMVKDTDILEESEVNILKETCGFTDIKCPKCNEDLYITSNNSYKCMKCGE